VLIPDAQVEVIVSQGVVELRGTVETRMQRHEAERALERLVGVRGIDNRIEVRPHVLAQDLRRAIDEALARHAARQARHVRISVENDQVVLEGTVHSPTEHEVVVGAARAISGTRAVVDHLRVEP
jgi:osmotically-inducible protein OsmY